MIRVVAWPSEIGTGRINEVTLSRPVSRAATVPGYPSGTRVINYPRNFLLPDGYPGSEYLICRIYLIGFSELVQYFQ